MSRRRVGIGLLALVIMGACGLLLFNLKESFLPDDSLDGQVRQLGSGWTSRRRAAATELARFSSDPEKAVTALIQALDDPDVEVRRNALESLEFFGEKSKPAAPALRQQLKQDADAKVRRQAVGLLGKLEDKESIPLLIEALDDPDTATRSEAARSLGQFGPGIATKDLIDKLLSYLDEDQAEELRLASLGALDSVARDNESVAPPPTWQPWTRASSYVPGP